MLALLLLTASPTGATSGPARAFVERTLAPGADARDSLATAFNPAQLPLVAAALAAAPDATGVAIDDLYRALARWHFWTGRRWDTARRGLWTVDPRTVPVGASQRGRTLAAHASLELVQLAALARLAAAGGHHHDALVWWSDHTSLRARLERGLHDPLRGGYADLDSTGALIERSGLDTLLPLALGAPSIPELARQAAWRAWADDEPSGAPGSTTRVAAIERADALNGWSGAPGLRLLEPEVTSALLYRAVQDLGDPTLSTLVRDALGTVGLAPTDSVTLRLGAWTPRLALDDLLAPPLARSRAAVRFLDAAGVLATDEADSLRRHLDAAADPDSLPRTVEILTAALARWRALDEGVQRYLWADRRQSRPPANGEGAVFRQQESDVRMWIGRALDRITEDVVEAHLRPRPRSPWRAEIVPAVAGRGERVGFVLTPALGTADDAPPPAGTVLSALWTDGLRILPPVEATLTSGEKGTLRADLGPCPQETGVWRLILEGLETGVRAPAAMAVVEPMELRVVPLRRKGTTALVRVEVGSQVRAPSIGRVEIEAPLSFTVEPSASIGFELPGGENRSWEISLKPSDEDGPGLYPVTWTLSDHRRRVRTVQGTVGVPFELLRLGPLRPEGDAPLEAAYAPDRRVDLAQRFRGVMRTVGWNRMPNSRLEADGWVRLADADDPLGVHYAYTAFTTGSREATLRIEAPTGALVHVNGRLAARVPDWGGQDRAEVLFGAGTNTVLVKIVGGDGTPARFRLDLRDIENTPLRGVENSLDMLLDEVAYLTRTGESDEERDIGRDSMRLVPFTYTDPDAASVSVVGSFNGWSPTATRMTSLGDGRWQAKVRVRPGRFEYKFAVDGDRWIADPANPEAVADGFGGRNSVLVVE